MLHLLKIEWLKVKNYRTFWILLILIAVSVPASIYMGFDISNNSLGKQGKQMQQMILGRPFSFPAIWQTGAWIASLILFIPSLLIITITTNEYTFKTHRQNIIDGLSRTQFISVKIIEVLILALFVSLLLFGSCVWVGSLATETGNTHGMFENIKQVGYFYIEATSYLMLAFLLSILIKRAGLVLGIFFLYSIILEEIFVGLARRYANNIGRFLPLETTDQLTPSPFSRLLKTADDISGWEKLLPVFLSLSLVYFIAYIVFSVYSFRTKDL
ncbi:MAG: ABC transporter permease [Chitinophagaceae bacterium]